MDVSQPQTAPIAATPSKQHELKKLGPKHKQAASLLAQGVGREQIARIVGVSPEYVTWLSRQPVFRTYIREMSEFVDTRLQALFDKGVEVLADTMKAGTEMGRLRAAQLVMRATGKEGTVQATVQHKHSLLAVLTTLPPAEAFQNGTSLPRLEKEVKSADEPSGAA